MAAPLVRMLTSIRKRDIATRAGRLTGRLLQALGVAIGAATIVVAAFAVLPPLAALEGALGDRLQVVARAAPPTQHPGVSVITVTEETMARLPYRSPVDRGFLADLLDTLGEAGVAGVALDILFDQATEPMKDRRLAESVRAFPVPVVIAWADRRAGLTEKQLAWLEDFAEASGAAPGGAGLVIDRDGVVRRHQPFDATTGVPSLPVALAAPDGWVGGDGDLIDWRGRTPDGKEPFQVLPAHSVTLMAARPAILRNWLAGRLVLVGADLPQQDRHRTALAADPSFETTLPGVVVHAHVAAQLLDGRGIEATGGDAAAASAFLAALLGVAIGFSGRPFWVQAFTGLALLLGWLALAYVLAVEARLLLSVATPVGALAVAFGASSSLDALRNRREKRFIRNAFAHYVAPQLVEQLTASPESLKLGGERRNLSFLFSDIAGFTTMSEALPPADLAALLNDYLDGMSDIVLAHGGTLDKFIGDAVVALFGAPVPQADHARRAVVCAVALDRFAEDFRAQHAAKGLGVTRIGVHSGEATVGNFGGRQRFDYTAMGDAMNTAARLEGANKAFGTRVAVSGDVLDAAGDALPDGVRMQPVGSVVLKGKTAGIRVFTPVSGVPDDYLACYAQALDDLDRSPEAARSGLTVLSRQRPDDPLVALHLTRLASGERGRTFELKEK